MFCYFGSYLPAPITCKGFPGGISGEESACHCRRHERLGSDPWDEKIPWRKKWQPTPLFFPGKLQGGDPGEPQPVTPWSHKGSRRIEHIHITCKHRCSLPIFYNFIPNPFWLFIFISLCFSFITSSYHPYRIFPISSLFLCCF